MSALNLSAAHPCALGALANVADAGLFSLPSLLDLPPALHSRQSCPVGGDWHGQHAAIVSYRKRPSRSVVFCLHVYCASRVFVLCPLLKCCWSPISSLLHQQCATGMRSWFASTAKSTKRMTMAPWRSSQSKATLPSCHCHTGKIVSASTSVFPASSRYLQYPSPVFCHGVTLLCLSSPSPLAMHAPWRSLSSIFHTQVPLLLSSSPLLCSAPLSWPHVHLMPSCRPSPQ
jgi:hypothetical protein